jgi:transcriptional regulator of acetoin/glycerol metabolism
MLIAALLPRLSTAPERVTLEKRAARALLAHSWPLNIRELEHALQVALSLSDEDQIQLEHLPEVIRRSPSWCDLPLSPKDRALRQQLTDLLHAEHGNVAAVARAMDRAPLQVRRWCSRLQIDVARFRRP